MLSVLEFAAIIAMAFFGIFGSLVDFRDRRGNISLKGWIGLGGVIIASTIVASLQVYSKYQEDKRAIALLDKNNTILSEINRTLNPLHGLTAEILLTADWSFGRLKEYFTEFEEGFGHTTSFGTFPLPSASCNLSENSQEADLSGPILFPSVSCEKGQVIYDAFCSFDVVLFFFKFSIVHQDFDYLRIGEDHGEDLKISFSSPCRFATMLTSLPDELKTGIKRVAAANLEYDLREGRVHRLDFRAIHDDVKEAASGWRGNSKIISLHDLLGSQLIILLATGQVVSEETQRLRETVTLRQLVLKLPHGIALSFDTKNLTRHESPHPYGVYSIRFPDTLNELLTVTSYDEFSLLD